MTYWVAFVLGFGALVSDLAIKTLDMGLKVLVVVYSLDDLLQAPGVLVGQGSILERADDQTIAQKQLLVK